jgi:hypothetical protein
MGSSGTRCRSFLNVSCSFLTRTSSTPRSEISLVHKAGRSLGWWRRSGQSSTSALVPWCIFVPLLVSISQVGPHWIERACFCSRVSRLDTGLAAPRRLAAWPGLCSMHGSKPVISQTIYFPKPLSTKRWMPMGGYECPLQKHDSQRRLTMPQSGQDRSAEGPNRPTWLEQAISF